MVQSWDFAIQPIPFQVGGTLRVDDPTYIQRRADDELYAGLSRGELCYVLTSRQIGKSSLMLQTKHRLSQSGWRCVALDLTSIGTEDITPTSGTRAFAPSSGWALNWENTKSFKPGGRASQGMPLSII